VVQLVGALRYNTKFAGCIPGDMEFDYASSGNDYHCEGPTDLSLSCADCLEILGTST